MKKLKFGFTGNSELLKNFSIKLGQWWYIFIAAAGSAMISIAASYTGAYNYSNHLEQYSNIVSFIIFIPWTWLITGTIMIIYGGKGTYNDLQNINTANKELMAENEKVYKLKEKINSITEDSEALQNQLSNLQVKLVTTWLKGCARQLNLGTHCRTTIYYYVDQNFYLLARYSQNPKYAEIHRQKFSRVNGVISKAWQHKVCVDIENIPCYKKEPEQYKEYMQDKYGYSHEKTEKLAMKSCQYVAISILEADIHIGVIVFESDKPGLWKTQKVAQIKKHCTEYQSYMVDFIHGGVRYDKTVKVSANADKDVDQEFIKTFGGEI